MSCPLKHLNMSNTRALQINVNIIFGTAHVRLTGPSRQLINLVSRDHYNDTHDVAK